LTAVVAALTFAALGLPAQSQEKESLGEAARKARAQKKAPAKPAKVLTNDEIVPGKKLAGTAEAAPAGAQEQTEATPETAAQPTEAGAAEAAWRRRFAEARAKVAQAEKELDILQREWEKSQVQYYPDPQKALKEQYNRKDINEHATKVEAKKKEIAQLKQGISDLEDELRQAGGDPGWAR
jgi:chromosome segregation ATPase